MNHGFPPTTDGRGCVHPRLRTTLSLLGLGLGIAVASLAADAPGPVQDSIPSGPSPGKGRALAGPLAQAKPPGPAQAPTGVRFDPVVRTIEGWTVSVDPALLNAGPDSDDARALAMLGNHLQRIRILVSPEPLAKLQTIGIWIERDHPTLKSMQYHPSADWLVEHGHDPRLARKVHITQARDLLSREQMLKHPAVVLHELAHGYHDQVLGFNNPELVAAYTAAKASGSYDNVLLYTGERVRHYGLTDPMEYFAEGTEAHLYRNDFYPFVRAELKEHDPVLHALLVRIWDPPR